MNWEYNLGKLEELKIYNMNKGNTFIFDDCSPKVGKLIGDI